MFAKNMTALSKGGSRKVHKNKGSQQAPMPDRAQITQLARGPGSVNDYAKATPMAQPMPDNLEGGF